MVLRRFGLLLTELAGLDSMKHSNNQRGDQFGRNLSLYLTALGDVSSLPSAVAVVPVYPIECCNSPYDSQVRGELSG